MQLADFMAYLDATLRGVEQFVSENKVIVTDQNRRRFVLQRVNRINKMTPILTIYDSLSRILHNIFVLEPVVLDSMQKNDLINTLKIGLKRLHTFLKQNIMYFLR